VARSGVPDPYRQQVRGGPGNANLGRKHLERRNLRIRVGERLLYRQLPDGSHIHAGNTSMTDSLDGIYWSVPSISSKIAFQDNKVYGNAGNGIYAATSGQVRCSADTLYGNDSFDLYNDSVSSVDARANWWGLPRPMR